MRPLYFASGYFAAGFFGQSQPEFGGYFGSGYFGSGYFGAGFYGPVTLSGAVTASLDATEAADTLTSSATVTVVDQPVSGGGISRPRPFPMLLHQPIIAHLDVTERPDTCEATATLGFDPVAMDNDLLLMAA